VNKWTIGTILGSALLAASKRSSGSISKRIQMPNNGICEMDEVLITEVSKVFHNEDIEYLQSLLTRKGIQNFEEFRNIVFGQRGDVNFTFPKSMIASFRLLSFDPGLSAEKELESLLREIVPKTWQQDTENVRFFVQDHTVDEYYWDDEAEEQLDHQVEVGRFYDRLDDYDFEWDENIPGNFEDGESNYGKTEVGEFYDSEEYWDEDDQREIVLDSIITSVWTRNPVLLDRIIQFLYSILIVHTLNLIKKDDTDWVSRNAGYTGEYYMNYTYPNMKITSNGFTKNLRGWDRQEPRVEIGSFGVLGLTTEKFYESINYFANIRTDRLFQMLLSSEMTTNTWDDGVTREFTITLKDLFHTVSFTARLNLGSLNALTFSGNLDVPGYIKTESKYKTGWFALFAYVNDVETNSSENHFIDVINKTPQWFQGWYKSRNTKKDKTKLRKR